jgi:hypothetical protein
MANIQKYEKWTPEAAREEKEAVDKLDPGNEFLKLVTGKNRLRILPPAKGQKTPMPLVFVHYVDTADDKTVSFVCPRMHAKRKCKTCERSDRLRASPSKKDQDAGFRIMAKRKHYANAIDRKNEEKGVQVYGFGKQVYEQLMAIIDDGDDFTDPGPEGFDVIVNKTGEGLKTEYKVKAVRDGSPLHEDAATVEEWLGGMHNLSRYAQVESDEDIAKKLGGSDGDDEDEDETPRAAPKGRAAAAPAKKTGGKSVIDAASEVDDEDDESDDD